jgi:hypothetical protein
VAPLSQAKRIARLGIPERARWLGHAETMPLQLCLGRTVVACLRALAAWASRTTGPWSGSTAPSGRTLPITIDENTRSRRAFAITSTARRATTPEPASGLNAALLRWLALAIQDQLRQAAKAGKDPFTRSWADSALMAASLKHISGLSRTGKPGCKDAANQRQKPWSCNRRAGDPGMGSDIHQ